MSGAPKSDISNPGRVRAFLRWKSPLRPAIRASLYFASLAAGALIGYAAGDAQLGFDIGLIVGAVVPDAGAAWLDHRGRLPAWGRAPAVVLPVAPPGMGVYSTLIPEDEYGPIYVGRSDQAALQVWLKRRRARARHGQSGQN